MNDRIKKFEQKNKNSQQTNSKSNIETPKKKQINTEVHKNKFVDESETSNSYVKQTIKKKSLIKMNNNANNVSFFQILKSKINNNDKNSNRSMEKGNLIYNNFVKNLKIDIKEKDDNDNDEIERTDKNRKRNKKKKNVFGNFLNQFVNKSQIQNEEISNNTQILIINNDTNVNNIHYFKNLSKINNIDIYIESSKKHDISIDKNNQDNNELILIKKELQLKENTIKELYKSLQKQNYIIQENEKLKEEIVNLKNILNRYNSNNNNAIKNNNIDDNAIKSRNCEINNYNNSITYNINKNNNYNIINSKIDSLDNLNNINSIGNINNINTIKTEKEVPPSINNQETKNEIENEKTKKANRAFERFKKNRSIDVPITKEGKERQNNLIKSDKISSFAKMLEGHIGNKARERSVDICEKNRNGIITEGNNDEIINIINNQPVINKKKKKIRSFSIDG